MAEFYVILAGSPKISEFFMTFARKIFFRKFFWGGGGSGHVRPRFYAAAAAAAADAVYMGNLMIAN